MSRVGIIQTAFIGDFVLTTPVISALRRVVGDEGLFVVARPFAKHIIKGRIIEFDKKDVTRKPLNLIRTILRVRSVRPSLVLVPHLSATSALISFFSGAKERIGFEENTLSFLFTKRIKKFVRGVIKESDRLSRILIPLGLKPAGPDIYVDKSLVEKWSETLSSVGSDQTAKKIIFAPFSNWNTKSYVFWRELLKELPEDLFFILLGETTKKLGYITDEKNVLDLTNKTTLKDAIAIIYISDVFLGVDNGLSHIASVLSKPCFVIFGPTVPEFGFFPNFSRYEIIQANIPCRPCSLHGPKSCPKKHFACMRQITPYAVVQNFLRFISDVRR